MKISVITVTFNSVKTLADTLETVATQDFPEIEHIIVDGGSTDGTVELIKSFSGNLKWVSEKDNGLYDAINKGISMATGDVVGILNSDDFFPNQQIASGIAKAFTADPTIDAVYGDVAFVKPENLKKLVRYYSAEKFHPARFKFGFMPPHPSFYVKREFYQKLGLYKEEYVIAADYELLMRFLLGNNLKTTYIPRVLVYMRTGGISNKNFNSRLLLNREIVKACQDNGIKTNLFLLSFKYVIKVFEFIMPHRKKSTSHA